MYECTNLIKLNDIFTFALRKNTCERMSPTTNPTKDEIDLVKTGFKPSDILYLPHRFVRFIDCSLLIILLLLLLLSKSLFDDTISFEMPSLLVATVDDSLL